MRTIMVIPTKKINDTRDLVYFKKSLAYKRLQDTISFIVTSVKGIEVPKDVLNAIILHKPVNDETLSSSSMLLSTQIQQDVELSKVTEQVLNVLQQFNVLIDDTPPDEGPRRFGNYAYRKWSKKLETTEILKQASTFNHHKHKFDEISYYLLNSFGSSTRLDFGTGHELSFIAFIGILLTDNEFSGTDFIRIFSTYYDIVRKLILVYNLEPAGSHGVWGLDDHFHFIYILGAAQFNDAKFQVPPVGQCLNDLVIKEYKLSNLYINGIAFINRIKTGPFREHSPIIYDIHVSVSLWKKVLSGLLKMYDVEVLGKFPVVQHFYFGEIYPWRDVNGNSLPETPTSGLMDATDKNNIKMTSAPWATADSRQR